MTFAREGPTLALLRASSSAGAGSARRQETFSPWITVAWGCEHRMAAGLVAAYQVHGYGGKDGEMGLPSHVNRAFAYNQSLGMPIDPHNYVDLREMPRYSVSEAALFLTIKRSTLRSWVKGRSYDTTKGRRRFEPIIEAASSESGDPALSFFNMAEAYVLSSLRLGHEVPLHKIRKSIEWLREAYPGKHPLINHEFFTDGAGVFVKKLLGKRLATIEASAGGQIVIEDIVNPYLDRVERDTSDVVKVFPSVPTVDAPKIISLVHNVASGRPIVDRAGIRASAIWSRAKAGESPSDLAEDYDINESEVNAAVQYINAINNAA